VVVTEANVLPEQLHVDGGRQRTQGDGAAGWRGYPKRLAVKTARSVVFVRIDDIQWIESAGNYVRFHAGDTVLRMRSTLASIEDRLDPNTFLRIHRCTLVNIDHIQQIQPSYHGEHVVVMANGQRLTISRSYRDRLRGLIDRGFLPA
jgi:two-component system LytT family response regulator